MNESSRKQHQLPINVLTGDAKMKTGHTLGSTANFFLEKDGELLYAVVNGYLVDLKNPELKNVRQKVY
jgi:hypothetical protein